MSISRWYPVREVASLQDRVNSLFQDFAGDSNAVTTAAFAPPVDVFENAEKVGSGPINLEKFSRAAQVVLHAFEVLPAGRWDVYRAAEYIRKKQLASRRRCAEQIVDEGRVREIKSLNPDVIRVGKKLWRGYIVCTFNNSQKVMLESLIGNNATYILQEEWENAISLTKAEVLEGFSDRVDRIIHNRNWRKNVCNVLGFHYLDL